MFSSIYDSISNTTATFFIILGTSVVLGILISFALSFVMHSTKKFFVTNALMTAIIATALSLISGSTGVAVAVAAVGLGLLRFRSVQASSEEIGALFISVVAGIALGAGYVLLGVIFAIVLTFVFILLSNFNIFHHRAQEAEKLVRITIPEDLNYVEVYDEIFKHYTKSYEYIRVKTADMGSLYKLSVRVVMKDPKEAKALLDEIRQRNGNMEVSIAPYSETANLTL
ncbi:MAG: DUF4956 domain-containing protein [Gammaproteobacteria bacterium]|nr:DUF4956 domain-containing protein [Gammaproteobacteria bacterium]